MSAIKHLLVMELKDTVTKACQTDVPTNDPSRVDLVTIRSAGSQISGKRMVMVIKHMDPLDPSGWGDSTVGDRIHGHTAGSHFPAAEFVGSGTRTFEVIKGIIEVTGNLTITKENTEKADEYIQEAIQRAKYAIRKRIPAILAMSDSFGEQIKQFSITGSVQYDSGGDSSNTTRDFIRWLAVTETGPDSTGV
jgi:hypothetical protein